MHMFIHKSDFFFENVDEKKKKSKLFKWSVTLGKAVTKEEESKNFLAAPKKVSFSQVPPVKKDTIFGAAIKIFRPS